MIDLKQHICYSGTLQFGNHTELVDDLYDANKNSAMSVQIDISFHIVFSFLLLP